MQEAIIEQSAPDLLSDDKPAPINLHRKTQLAIKMIDAGISPREALQTVHNNREMSDQAVSILKKKAETISITTPYIVGLAKRQLMRMLRGKAREAVKEKIIDAKGKSITRTQMLFPSEKDMLSAMSMVLDRAIPKAEERTGGNTTNIFNFDPRSSIKIAEIVTQAAGQLQAQPQITQQPPAQAQAQVIEVEGKPTPDNW
jgi:hypothetical protein